MKMAKQTPAQMQQDEQDFAAAYDEDMPTPVEQTEDEAFGLTPEVNEEDSYPNSPDEAEAVADEAAAEDAPVDIAEPVEAAETEPAKGDDLAKEVQRLKSWEGRLKAMEAQLKAGKPADEAEATEATEETVEEVEDVAKSEITSVDGAIKALAADFGDEFTKMLMMIIDSKVNQANEGVAKSVDEIINDIVDTKAKAHFEAIADKHPDFMEIADSQEFAAYLNAMPEAEKAKAQQIVEGGTSREIVALLSSYKATVSTPEAEPEMEQADESMMDAAEGVRSSGMRLPMQPAAASGDYAAAWDEFKD
jgi:hypothetical protein